MGSDLCLISVCWKGKMTPERVKRIKDVMAERIANLKEDNSFVSDSGLDMDYARDALTMGAEDLVIALNGDHREADLFFLADSDTTILNAGGMTWGDDPSDLWGCIHNLYAADIIPVKPLEGGDNSVYYLID